MVLQNAPLEVSGVHLFPLENAEQHHAQNFELVHLEPPTPVLRRGQPFRAELRVQGRAYDAARDAVRFIFNFGQEPSVMHGTRGIALLNPKVEPKQKMGQWTAKQLELQPDKITVEINSPPDAPVGVWELQVKTMFKDSSPGESVYKYKGDIYLLFNPWNPEDQTFMDNERLLEEYVLNDVGKVWVGPHNGFKGREWVFGQFDAIALKAVMLMLERSRMKPQVRGDPVLLARKISQMVNSNDSDGGIITGRWFGDYDDGTAPTAWTGSVAILEQYLNTKSSVKYGQCWVFAAVATTVCRALGIPARPVSNLVSAHDSDVTLSVDYYYNEKNESISVGRDSTWNYHVWNEVWMARPDLPKGYGGWQAIDATPQERSERLFQCGPASLEAIKKGAVGLNYDVPFLLAEVNADIMRWKRNPSDENGLGYSRIDSNKYHVGRIILTKQPWIYDPNGDKDREDVTDAYKEKEGTTEERFALMNGVRSLERAKRYYQVPDLKSADVDFELQDIDKINIGDPFQIAVNIHNKAKEVRTVECMLSTDSFYYNGNKAHEIKRLSETFKVQPNEKKELRLEVQPDEYLEKLVEYCNMKIHVIATVSETRYTWADEDDFLVEKPPIIVKLPKTLPVNKSATAKLSFKNPLKKTLTQCKIRLEAPGLIRTARPVLPYRDVQPLEEISLDYEITPTKVGNLKLIATFYSKELVDITGSAVVDVS